MAVQVITNYSNLPFALGGDVLVEDNETFVQDAGRSGNIVKYTVCSKDANGKWVPFTDETATDGTQVPAGIVLATLTEAEIKAGDVTGVAVLRRANIIDTEQITIENSKTLDTIIASDDISVKDSLQRQGIFIGATKQGVNFENA